jgi:hypothetical protein
MNGDNIFIWDGDDVLGNDELVTKARYADSYGQVLLAAGAALAGLGIGLIPAAFEAVAVNRRRRAIARLSSNNRSASQSSP